MNSNINVLRRPAFLLAAIAVALASLLPALSQLVHADQVSTRSIEMSDSTPSHTNTTYKLTFTPTTGTVRSFVVDFCSNSSIIGGSCTASDIDAKASIALSTGPSGWTVDTTPTFMSSRTNAIAAKGTSDLGTSAVSFEFTGITNPTTTGTFWARIYTYTNNSYGSTTYTDPQNLGNYVDYGGFAMSTTSLINISATVMETLTFCVNKAQPGNGCTSLTTPVNLTLGHGTPQVLDSSAVDTDGAYFQISTNALTGAAIRMKSHNTCSGLSRNGGTDSCPIPGIGTTSAFSNGVANFGMHLTTVAGGTGSLVSASDYSDTTTTNYGMTTGASGVTSTYGAQIADTNSTATANVNDQMTFAAQASVTTPAGVYTANESLIATGTF